MKKSHWYALGGFVAGTVFGAKVVGLVKRFL